jgi:DNA-binding NtrC family response regulator
MANFEREVIGTVLAQYHFNQGRAADHLKISRHALRYRMQRLNIPGGPENDEEPPHAAKIP